MSRTTEFTAKLQSLTRLLDELQADALMLESQPSLAWFLCGARVHVSLAGAPVVRVLVHRGGAELATTVSEVERLCAEELTDLSGLRTHAVPWHANLDDHRSWFPGSACLRVIGEAAVSGQLQRLRSVLNPEELARYRVLCRDTAEIFTEVFPALNPASTEHQTAALLAQEVIRRGGEALVVLVAGAVRGRHRHPLPTHDVLGRRAMAVLCVRRHGLIANATRWIRFGAPGAVERSGETQILEVERDIYAALRSDMPLKDLLPAIQAAYPRRGFAADEWQRHHQGGIAGYDGRDPRFSPDSSAPVRSGQALAFNPSASLAGQTFKVEDTVLYSDGRKRLQVLTADPRWPSVNVGGLLRPATFEA